VKVVHVITRLELGGAQQNTLYTLEHLGPEFEGVLVAGPGGILDSQTDDDRFRTRFFPELVHPISPVHDLIALLQLFQCFKTESPEIVHTHSSKAGILGRVAAWLAGVPVIVHTYHGFGFHERQSACRRALYLALERIACRVSTKLIFVSEANLEAARRQGLVREGQDVLIRSGVRLNDFPATIEDRGKKKASLQCGMHKPLVVSVGNLKPQKNPEAFVRVAAKTLEKDPDVRFLFVGDGELRTRVESMIVSHRLHGKVFFPGWRKDVAEIIAAADIFALTSLWEGLPRSLIEAMKSGLPSVCYATDGVRDVIRDGENGFLVDPGDEARMAERILELAQDADKAKRMGQAAAATIGKEFDIDEMVRAQERLYRELTAGEVGARRQLVNFDRPS